jgi:uncharacterized Zn-finger protein
MYFYKLKNLNTIFCIDDMGKEEGNVFLAVYHCTGNSLNQFFSWSHNDEIRHEDYCLIAENSIGSKPKLVHCDGNEDQKWKHSKVFLKVVFSFINFNFLNKEWFHGS